MYCTIYRWYRVVCASALYGGVVSDRVGFLLDVAGVLYTYANATPTIYTVHEPTEPRANGVTIDFTLHSHSITPLHVRNDSGNAD